jgi:hypothetical protein
MAWLDCLRDEDVDVEWTTTMAGGSDGDCRPDHEPIRARLAAIGDVCTSSARVCRKLHAEALTIERLPPGTPAAAVDESQPEPDATEGPASSAPDPLDSKQGRMAAVTACRAACAVAEGRLIPPPANWVWKAAEYADRRPYHDWINTGTNSARFRTVLRLPAEEVIKRARAWRPKSR